MAKYADIPEFGQIVEYVTQADPVMGENGELFYGIEIHSSNLGEMDLIDGAEVLYNDFVKVAAKREIEDLPPQSIQEIKEKIAETYHTDIASLVTVSPNPVEIMSAIAQVKTYPVWKAGIAVKAGDAYLYEPDKNLYQVIQGHTTQKDWTPIVAKALYKRYYEPDGDPWPWVQPLGSHDAYPIGARVLFDGRVWRSKLSANVWSPAAYPQGWEDLGALAAAPERRG